MGQTSKSNNSFFSFLDHLSFVEDDSSNYEVGVSDQGFSYLNLASEKQRKISFKEKQSRASGAATDGSTRAHGKSNISKVEMIEPDEIRLDTDLMAILKDIDNRRHKQPYLPFAIGITVLFLLVWLFIPSYSSNPRFDMIFFGAFLFPVSALLLFNIARLDHSRRNVNFTYKIEGLGKKAFQEIDSALSSLDNAGQNHLLIGRKHFDDTRYSGGAKNQPDFARISFSKEKPPLLDLDFDVWRLKAFRKDFYFMPDHLLVYEGASAGGVDYSKIEFNLDKEIIQARNELKVTPDAKVVGKAWRFVNKDGSPDQRFNNNVEIPEIEYGVLKLQGSGIDICVYSTNQTSTASFPERFSVIKGLSTKPKNSNHEKIESGVETPTKAISDKANIFDTILECLSYMVLVDGNIESEELDKVQKIMVRIKSPYSSDDVSIFFSTFSRKARSEGLNKMEGRICKNVKSIKDDKQKHVLLRCLDHVAGADGVLDKKEVAFREKVANCLGID